MQRNASPRLALEQRIVFDAAMAGAGAELLDRNADHGEYTPPAVPRATSQPVRIQAAEPATAPPRPAPERIDDVSAVARPSAPIDTAARVEIIFVDSAVQDIQTFLHGRNAEVVVLQAGRDGVDQIAQVLAGRTGISAIHIISHGEAGEIVLGTGVPDAQTMSGIYALDLATIKSALAPGADVLVYGCNAGAGAGGQAFMAALANATGADIEASTDSTGAVALGGNWTLETSTGHVETLSISAKDWNGLLTVAAANGSGALLGVNGNSIYSIDITTGKATLLTSAPATIGGVTLSGTINSLAMDTADGLLYYVDQNGVNANRALFAYDFRTAGLTDAARHLLIDSDLTNNGAGLSIAVGVSGVGQAGATFGNGGLYLAVLSNAVQQGTSATATDDTNYKISFTGAGRTISNVAVLVSPITGAHAWGDIGFDGATNTILDSSSTNILTRYDATTGAVVGTATTVGLPIQTALGVAGNTYLVGASVQEVNPVTGVAIGAAVAITNSAGTALTMLDASTAPPAQVTIGDKIFDDNNTNAVFDAGDVGIANVTVQLIDDRNNNGVVDAGERILATDTTNATGDYLFTGVLPGNYIVRVTDTNAVLGTAPYTTAGAALNPNADIIATATNSAIVQDLLTIDFGVNNRPPVNTVPGAQAATEDTALPIAGVSVNDVDSNLATSQISVANGNLTVSLAGGATISAGANGSGTLTLSGTQVQINAALASISYLGNLNFNGTDTLTILSTDKASSTDTKTVTINVAAVNDPPVGVPDSGAVVESGVNPGNTAFTGTPSASGNVLTNDTDPDAGDTKTVNTVNGSAANVGAVISGTYGAVTIAANGTYTYTLNNALPATQALAQGQVVTEVFNYNLKDTAGLVSNTTTLTISATGTNDAPVGVPDSASVVESGVNPGNTAFAGTPSATGNVLANDTDPDALDTKTVSQVNGAAGNVGSTLATTYGTVTIGANGAYTYTLNNALPATQALAQGQGVTEVITYRVRDAAGLFSDTTLTVSVTGTNDTPVAVLDTASTPLNVPLLNINVKANDTDVDNTPAQLTVSSPVLATPAQGTVTLNGDGTLNFTPASGVTGPVIINYTLTDNLGASTTGTLQVNVGGINTPPVAGNDSASTVQNTAFTLAAGMLIANDTDADGNPLTITSVQSPTNGTVALVAGSVVFTPTPGYTGPASFTYTISDGQGGTSIATVNVTVTALVVVNNPPLANADANSVVESGVNPGNTSFAGTPSASGNVLSNDTDPDAADTKTVSAVNGSAANVGSAIAGTYGYVQISADGSYTYTLDNARPATQALAQGQAASEVFSYVVRDAAGATSSSTLTITVTGTNDAPVANADSNAVVESGVNPGNTAFAGTPSASGDVLANDTDPDAADTKAVNAVNGSAANVGSTITGIYGTVNIAANGTYTLHPGQCTSRHPGAYPGPGGLRGVQLRPQRRFGGRQQHHHTDHQCHRHQ